MKLEGDFYYVPKGKIYPVLAKAGDAVPGGYEDVCAANGLTKAVKPELKNKAIKPKTKVKSDG